MEGTNSYTLSGFNDIEGNNAWAELEIGPPSDPTTVASVNRSLLRVPWITFDGDAREVCSDPPVDQEQLDDDIVEDRLESLGYV
ncbi:hypothetical protein [Halapricum desulfuricans]|uniref:hypothetical protein n=1 Tax=Halapricum desulfuricans TaxID=2841257 RepID=UPI001E3975CD|nr:hypothetical protein [Halapricum desulfuricans]